MCSRIISDRVPVDELVYGFSSWYKALAKINAPNQANLNQCELQRIRGGYLPKTG